MTGMGWRKVFQFLIAYALLLIFMLSVPMHIHRHAFDEAFSAWYKNRTPENEAALRVQQRKNELFELELCALGALIVLVAGYGLYRLVRLTTQPRKV
jgi:hypothetical protein